LHFTSLGFQVLGSKRKTLAGYNSANINSHHGFIYGCSLVPSSHQYIAAVSIN
jgi:hypothetical protein